MASQKSPTDLDAACTQIGVASSMLGRPFSDDDDRYVFQGVHMMLEGDHQRKWKEGEPRESRLVFIGRELPEQIIRDGFESCITS